MFVPPKEGVGNAGRPVHPQPRARILVVSMRTSIHSEVTGIIRHSRTRMVYGLYVISPVIGFLATVIDGVASVHLTPAPRRQDHTTSPSASGALVFSTVRVHRSPPRVCDDRERPSSGTGWQRI